MAKNTNDPLDPSTWQPHYPHPPWGEEAPAEADKPVEVPEEVDVVKKAK